MKNLCPSCALENELKIKDGSTVRYVGTVRTEGTRQLLLRSTVHWYGTPFLQWY